jgi:hypothetical protein
MRQVLVGCGSLAQVIDGRAQLGGAPGIGIEPDLADLDAG